MQPELRGSVSSTPAGTAPGHDASARARQARLILGTTAHRDIPEAMQEEVATAVRAFLRRLQHEYPALPLAVMSALAEGGDRIVARCAVDLGIPLIAPLPMSRSAYLADFTTAASREEFNRLAAAAELIELPIVDGSDASLASVPGAARDRQYAQLGAFVSSHCQILLALWDGLPGTELGGTGDVVRYHLHGDMSDHATRQSRPNLLADDDSDLVYHILCARDQHGEVAVSPIQESWVTTAGRLPGSEPMPEAYRAMFRQLSEFNADIAKYEPEIALGRTLLLPDPTLWPAGIRAVEHLFAGADWLAVHFRKRMHGSVLMLHTLALLMGGAFILYSELNVSSSFVGAFLLLFAAGSLLALVGQRREWHRRYLDYRVLAEGLRVQCYWTIAGVRTTHQVRFAYDSFLQKQDVELGWIRHVMRTASLAAATGGIAAQQRLDWAIESWIGDPEDADGQLGYYGRRGAQLERKYRITTWVGVLSLGVSLAAALGLFVAGDSAPDSWTKPLLVMMGFAALIAAVRTSYSHQLADRELIRQYRFMHRIFRRASERIAATSDADQQRRILEALGQAALEEHAEWILTHRERPIEPNRPG